MRFYKTSTERFAKAYSIFSNLSRDTLVASWQILSMKKAFMASLLFPLSLAISFGQVDKSEKPKVESPKSGSTNEVAVIKTTQGEMVIEFWPDVAPKTVENFKKLARQGFYDGTAFHRIVKGFMIQGGDPLSKKDDPAVGTGGPGYRVKAEFSERPHLRGVLSMARSADPDSAGSQFFVCLAPAPSLDRQYTAFGKLIKGDDVLEKIGDTPVGASSQGERSKPNSRVGLESIKIVPAESIKKEAP